MANITLNEALKLRKYDEAKFADLEADDGKVDVLTTLGETIHLGAVDLENDTPGYFKIGNALSKITGTMPDDTQANLVGLFGDDNVSFGDPRYQSYLVFNSKDLLALPMEAVTVLINTEDTATSTMSPVTVGSTTVYEFSYDYTYEKSALLESTTLDSSAVSKIRLIIEDSSGNVIYKTNSDADFLAGGGFTVPAMSFTTDLAAVIGLLGGEEYTYKYQSLTDSLRLKGSTVGGQFLPKASFDGYDSIPERVVYFPEWTAKTYAKGDTIFQDNKLYYCKQDGAQTGSFADNVNKWKSYGAPDTPHEYKEPELNNFVINIPPHISIDTDLNKAWDIQWDLVNHNNLSDLALYVDDVLADSISGPYASAHIAKTVVLSGIDTSSPRNVKFQLKGHDTQIPAKEVVSTIYISVVGDGKNYVYYGPSDSNSLDSIDIASLAEKEDAHQDRKEYIDSSIAAYTGNKYFVVAFPDSMSLLSISIDGMNQTSGFIRLGTKTINTVVYRSYVSNNKINIASSRFDVRFV